jgi:hypothetical protein
MIFGSHIVVYSKDAKTDRAFFHEVLGFPSVDAGHGWLIFELPPCEAAFHPAEDNDRPELYFMCHDLKAEMASLTAKGARFGDVQEARWGWIAKIKLPGGGEIGLYQPRHLSPLTDKPASTDSKSTDGRPSDSKPADSKPADSQPKS